MSEVVKVVVSVPLDLASLCLTVGIVSVHVRVAGGPRIGSAAA